MSGESGNGTAQDLPDTVYVSASAPSNEKKIHTDPDCHVLEDIDAVEKDSGVVGGTYPVCAYCAGERTVIAVENANATRIKLESMSPEDVGLSPIGERRQA